MVHSVLFMFCPIFGELEKGEPRAASDEVLFCPKIKFFEDLLLPSSFTAPSIEEFSVLALFFLLIFFISKLIKFKLVEMLLKFDEHV